MISSHQLLNALVEHKVFTLQVVYSALVSYKVQDEHAGCDKVNRLITLIVIAIWEEMDEEINEIKEKKLRIRNWIDRSDNLGTTNLLLKKLALENPNE